MRGAPAPGPRNHHTPATGGSHVGAGPGSSVPRVPHQGAGAFFPAGLAYGSTSHGDRLYVADNLSALAGGSAGNAPGHTDIELSPADDPDQADHPGAIAANPERHEVYTANANSDTVSVIDTDSDTLAATIDVALVPGAAKVAIPSGLAVSPDGDQPRRARQHVLHAELRHALSRRCARAAAR